MLHEQPGLFRSQKLAFTILLVSLPTDSVMISRLLWYRVVNLDVCLLSQASLNSLTGGRSYTNEQPDNYNV